MWSPIPLPEGSASDSAADEAKARPRLVLADDHADVLEEIRCLLEPDFHVVSSAANGKELVRAVFESKPDGVVTDFEMPGLNGIEAGREIARLSLCSAVVILSMYSDSQLVLKALDSGVLGYVLKEDAGEELVPAVQAALQGKRYMSRGVRIAGAY
jgi:DNA-binding NarL/FixJ family response regulator